MNRYVRFILLATTFAALTVGCQPSTPTDASPTTTTAPADPYAHIEDQAASVLLKKAIDRAGGLEAWNKLKRLSFQKFYSLFDEAQQVEKSAQQQHHYFYQPKKMVEIQWLEKGKVHQIVQDGNRVSKLINAQVDATAKTESLLKTIESATFVVSIPFKLLDKGVALSYAGKDTLDNGKAVEVLKAVYNPSTHDTHTTPDTWWHYYDAADYTFVGYMVQHADHYSYVLNTTFEEKGGFIFPKDRKSYRVDAERNKLYLRAEYAYANYVVKQ
ncbi:MAG: hypothetical protein AAF798_04230 [Bacteroidota bacterium]